MYLLVIQGSKNYIIKHSPIKTQSNLQKKFYANTMYVQNIYKVQPFCRFSLHILYISRTFIRTDRALVF